MFRSFWLKGSKRFLFQKESVRFCVPGTNTMSSFDLLLFNSAVTESLFAITFLYVVVFRPLSPSLFFPIGARSTTNLSLYKNHVVSLINLNSWINDKPVTKFMFTSSDGRNVIF